MGRSTILLLICLVFTSSHAQERQITRQPQAKNVTQTGELSFEYNRQVYDAIVVDPKKQRIKMHWRSGNGKPYKNLEEVKIALQKKKEKVLMLTNGGMYLEHNIPQGLFIAEGKQQRILDTASNKPGNFYMQPNGVFYVDKMGAHVVTRNSYEQLVRQKKVQPLYATQSGPMLLTAGEINQQFNAQSTNLNLRSGVGILPNGNVVFIISRSDKTSFYDFATIFKEKFGCQYALYLDGAISRMYLPGLRTVDTGGDFGAIISVEED